MMMPCGTWFLTIVGMPTYFQVQALPRNLVSKLCQTEFPPPQVANLHSQKSHKEGRKSNLFHLNFALRLTYLTGHQEWPRL